MNGKSSAAQACPRIGNQIRRCFRKKRMNGARPERMARVLRNQLGTDSTAVVEALRADLKARGTAAKVFLNDCIAKLLRGELDVTTASIAKYWLTELQGEVVDKCLQLHGGWGYINEYPIAKMFRDSRITRIFGGSNEIMKMVIARSNLRWPV